MIFIELECLINIVPLGFFFWYSLLSKILTLPFMFYIFIITIFPLAYIGYLLHI